MPQKVSKHARSSGSFLHCPAGIDQGVANSWGYKGIASPCIWFSPSAAQMCPELSRTSSCSLISLLPSKIFACASITFFPPQLSPVTARLERQRGLLLHSSTTNTLSYLGSSGMLHLQKDWDSEFKSSNLARFYLLIC